MAQFKRILLAEDDPLDIELTVKSLEEYHLANNVDVVHDGVEALDYLRRRNAYASRQPGNPIVILLDIKMPKMNGIEVLKEVKADQELSLIPVVMLTSSREAKDIQECYRLGVNSYVVKPVRFSEFFEAVKQVGVFWAMINEPSPETSSL